MDFSTIPRALESLQRRHPPLDAKVLDASKTLLLCQKQTDETSQLSPQDFWDDVKVLLLFHQQEQSTATEEEAPAPQAKATRRWEPLAVGLFVATQLLQQQLPRLEQESNNNAVQGNAVYMDGPRVPSIQHQQEHAAVPENGIPATVSIQKPPQMDNFLCPDLDNDLILSVCQTLHPVALEHLEDSEPRVRTLVAKAAGVYCKVSLLLEPSYGDNKEQLQLLQEIRNSVHQRVMTSIQQHLETGRAEAEKQAAAAAADSNQNGETPENGGNASAETGEEPVEQYSRSSTGALDDTTGWRALETNWQCLAALIHAMGPSYLKHFGIDSQLMQDLKHSCIVHVNRHVRAAGMAVLEQIVATALAASLGGSPSDLLANSSEFGKIMVAVLKDGLADNWSQVRMAASVLCRAYLMALIQVGTDLQPLFVTLLPRMCLNRFYLAQGVKLYSHETWRMVFDNVNQESSSGIGHVVQHLAAICRYYVKMCDANNHVVREAACQAIAELAVRLGEDKNYHDELQPLVDLLLQALLMCFHDESWPVRDEACLACGILCRSYPEECRPELTTLWERWTEQLTDQIWSVRQDAAVALGDALEAYGNDFYQQKIKGLLKDLMPSAKKQAPMTMSEYKARQNDAAAHTNSQLFSCGSLAPKLHKRKDGAGRIGCSSCDVTRERQLWEATDGCVYLVRELVIRCSAEDSVVPLPEAELKAYLMELADVCRVKHFPQADDLRATLWRQLPAMAEALGKQRFKRNGYLEIFCDLLFSSMESGTASQLCRHAAGQCADELAQFMGVAIFRGRLEDYQRDIFDQVMRERQAMPKGPSDGAAFSPFGPPGLLDNVGQAPPFAMPGTAAGTMFPGRV